MLQFHVALEPDALGRDAPLVILLVKLNLLRSVDLGLPAHARSVPSNIQKAGFSRLLSIVD